MLDLLNRAVSVLVMLSILVYCATMASVVDVCVQEISFGGSLCCLLGIWAKGSVYRYCTLFFVLTVSSIVSLLALRKGRENLPAADFIGVGLGIMLWGLLSDIVSFSCK